MLKVLALAAQCGVAVEPQILAAIVDVESQGNPYALSVNGDYELARQPRDREEAVAMAKWLISHGFNFDAGLGQVNSANFERLRLGAVDLFDTCSNLRAASVILGECYERAVQRFGEGESAAEAAVSCYNTGNFRGGQRNGYVQAVRASAGGPLVVRTQAGQQRAVGDEAPIKLTQKAKRAKKRVGTPPSIDRTTTGVFAERVLDVFAQSRSDAKRTDPPSGEGGPLIAEVRRE